jgi:uncharacterized protein GlcG (DUF336 family)
MRHALATKRGGRAGKLIGLVAAVATGALLVDCGGGGSSRAPGNGTNTPSNLTAAQVQTIILQAVNEASARGTPATIAVVDRVGNVLGVMQMAGAPTTVTVSSAPRSVPASGLEGLSGIPATLAAISKAITGAYLSSNGNAFTTRTASQIIQEHFNPGTNNQPGGPLFGVQFSQLPCSDLMTDVTSGSGTFGGVPGPGPHRAPLGLAADPGGLPLYNNGTLVGGIGVMASSTYGISAFPANGFDVNGQELIAIAGQSGFTPPDAILANRITAGGLTLRYTDSDASQLIVKPPSASGTYTATAVTGYYTAATTLAGTTFLTAASGIMRDPTNLYPGVEAYVLVDNTGAVRFPPTAATVPAGSALTQADARNLVVQGLGVAFSARAQIRQPLNSFAQVTVSVVDTNGNILAMARTPDAPIFGTDVSLQKARTAMFFSRTTAGAEVIAASSTVATYITNARTAAFLGANGFADGIAWSARAMGNLSRPFYPDGIDANPNGPLSRPFASWSVFTDGLQLDLVSGNVLALAGGSAASSQQCSGAQAFSGAGGLPLVGTGGKTALANGLQIFAGGMPVYRGGVLVGGIGVSGDGIDQDDMISFLGAARAGGGIGNAPTGIRADTLNPGGQGNLRYVNCPFQPFLDSQASNVCAGL